MKKLILSFAAFTTALLAQDLTGTWQGALQAPNRELRTVIKISKADGGGLKGVLYSIDQSGQGVPVSAITVQGSTVKMTVPLIGGSFEGKLDSDAVSITGSFTQGNTAMPLVLKHVTGEAAWAIPAPLKPMRADANPVFEVATIKPSEPGRPGKAFGVNGRHFSTLNTTLNDMITFAYGVHARQIVGGPAWLAAEKYDLSAQPEGEGQPNQAQWKTMVQKLLADRFQLSFHREKRELAVYAIVVAKGGSKLTRSEGDPNGLPSLMFRGLGVLPARNASLADFAGVMQAAVLDRPVVDQTGLPGKYDFMLTWTPDEFQFTAMGVKVPPPPDNATAPDLFTAFQEQLGLRLESTKAPAEVLVIDRAEKPSEN